MNALKLSSLLMALVAAGCSTAPPPPNANISVPASYKEAASLQGTWKTAQPAENKARGAWWQGFNDSALDQLEQQAEATNPSLAVAASRVKAARTTLSASRADYLPQVNLSAGVTRQKAAPAQQGLDSNTRLPTASVWNAAVGGSYEVDVFQRVANSVNAAQAKSQATEATYRSVLLALQADVAQAYFQLRMLDAETALLRSTIKLLEETLRLIERRQAAGDVSELDVMRARTGVSTTKAELQKALGRRALAEHVLALLLGQAPSAFAFAPQPLPVDMLVPNVPVGLPSALLERRADVAAAQARMMEATARLGQARSALFPALVLTAQGGYASYELKHLFAWSVRTWLASAVMSLPLFDGGRNKAFIANAESLLDESVIDYRSVVLRAFGDVEDQLAALAAVRSESAALDEAVVAARRSVELADMRYRAGEDSYLTLMDTQRSQLFIERQAIQLRGNQALLTVGLIRALGGDFLGD